jgi:tetratricopeptide (TPR) repeat protein
MKSLISFYIPTLTVVCAIGCGPSVQLPSVHEPIDSQAWRDCAGEPFDREAMGLIDELSMDHQGMLCQGVVAAASGQTETGLGLLTEAGVRDKKDHRPHYLAGRVLAEAGRYEEALTEFERSTTRFPSIKVPTERLGRNLLEKKGNTEARVFLDAANDRKLCPYGCLGLLARLLHEAKEDEKATAIYEEMVKTDPSEPAAYVGLAGMLNRKAEYVEEAGMLDKAVATEHFKHLGDSQRADIFYSLSFARYNAREFAAAYAGIEKAIEIVDERGDWHVLAGWISLKRDRPVDALLHFEDAAELNPKLAAAYTGIGDAQLVQKQNNEAKEAFAKARELDPTNTVIILKQALATAHDGDLETAARLVDEAASMGKDNLPKEVLTEVTDLLKTMEPKDQAETETTP